MRSRQLLRLRGDVADCSSAACGWRVKKSIGSVEQDGGVEGGGDSWRVKVVGISRIEKDGGMQDIVQGQQ